MDTPHTMEDLRLVAARGSELERFLESQGVQHALALTRARLYEDTMRGESLAIREEARAEARGLERLLEGFREIQNAGIAARETLKALERDDEPSGS